MGEERGEEGAEAGHGDTSKRDRSSGGFPKWKGKQGNLRSPGSICSGSEDKGEGGLGDRRAAAHGIEMPFISLCTVIIFNADPNPFCLREIMKAALFESEGL